MEIGIVGTGYVGLVAATCFAQAGHQLICADSDREKLASLRDGKVPFYEPGLQELLHKHRSRLRFVDQIQELSGCAVIFIAVGTPERPGGRPDMEPTFRVLLEICASARGPLFIALKSTVPIGTSAFAVALCRERCPHPVEIVSNPEFLRQGAAITDFLEPDRVVIGCASKPAEERMREVYRSFVPDEKILVMDNSSAEMVKYAANSFLALKISFINELALLADRWGADIEQVRAGFSADHRINPSYFQPGIGFGGSCLPKDVRALIFAAHEIGLELPILKAIDDVNERQKSLFIERVHKKFGDSKSRKIAVWGLAFKPHTDDIRSSPALEIVEKLVSLGADVSAYDPVAMKNAQQSCRRKFHAAASALEAASQADALLIVTEWPEFARVDLEKLRKVMRSPVIFDGRNLLDPRSLEAAGFEYLSIGRPDASWQADERKAARAG